MATQNGYSFICRINFARTIVGFVEKWSHGSGLITAHNRLTIDCQVYAMSKHKSDAQINTFDFRELTHEQNV